MFDSTKIQEVNDVQRKIAKVEDELDITISSTKDTAEKLELADKEAVDAELQAGALKRRLALLEEECARVKVNFQYFIFESQISNGIESVGF